MDEILTYLELKIKRILKNVEYAIKLLVKNVVKLIDQEKNRDTKAYFHLRNITMCLGLIWLTFYLGIEVLTIGTLFIDKQGLSQVGHWYDLPYILTAGVIVYAALLYTVRNFVTSKPKDV